jgi:protein SCO1
VNPATREIRWAIRWLSVLLCCVTLQACSGGYDAPVSRHARIISGVMPPLKFALTSDRGTSATAADFLGKITLLYFGYTSCPDACPMTLMGISQAVKHLGAAAESVRVLFVSVDPQRDSPQVLRRYASAFGPQVIGLTGTDDQLTSLTKRYRVAYRRDAPNGNGDYTVYHSSAVFVFDGDGNARLLVTSTGPDSHLAEDLQSLMRVDPVAPQIRR